MTGILALVYVALVVGAIWLTVALWRAVFRIAKATEETARLLRERLQQPEGNAPEAPSLKMRENYERWKADQSKAPNP